MLPIRNHRIDAMSEITQKYIAPGPPLQNENTSASLGFIGSIGFLSLISISLLDLIMKILHQTFIENSLI